MAAIANEDNFDKLGNSAFLVDILIYLLRVTITNNEDYKSSTN